MSRARAHILLVACLGFLTGFAALTPFVEACSAGDPPQSGGRTFTDALDRTITWSTAPGRIVSLSPNLTEILFALGLEPESIVGVTRFCDHPPEAGQIDVVGGIVDPNLERIASLEPDLVLATRGVPLETMTSLERLGLPVYALETRGEIDQILTNIRLIGAVTGRRAAGEKLADTLQGRIDRLTARLQDVPAAERPRVYYGDLEGPHWTAGPGSFIHALITLAGGQNIAAQAPAAWTPLSLETIVAADPQVYLGTFDPAAESADEARARAGDLLRNHEGWRATRLGKATSPRIMMVATDRLQRPGPRVIDVLEEFARFLHPHCWEKSTGEGGR